MDKIDCNDINLTELIGILLFETVKDLDATELKQFITSYNHIIYNCDLCLYEFKNMLDEEIDELNKDELYFLRNLSKNLLELNGDFYIHPMPPSIQ